LTLASFSLFSGELAVALRKNPYEVNMLIGGFDAGKGASLYFMDYMASLIKVDKAAHGYCSYFILSVMDKYWKPNMTLDEGIDLITKVRPCACV
jgi:20S proteasome subunit beta 4